MLSNRTFYKTRIHQLFDGLIFVKENLEVHVQHMLERSRDIYYGVNFKLNVWKNRREIRDLILQYDYNLTN